MNYNLYLIRFISDLFIYLSVSIVVKRRKRGCCLFYLCFFIGFGDLSWFKLDLGSFFVLWLVRFGWVFLECEIIG